MRYVLLGAAAMIAAVAVPASANAERSGGSGFAAANSHGSVRIHRGFDRDDRRRGDRRRDRDRDNRDNRDFRDEWRSADRDRRNRSDGDLYLGDREYQGDTLWRSDSFNDWWHDRPSRAYPAWVSRNTDCERLWWSGGGWHC